MRSTARVSRCSSCTAGSARATCSPAIVLPALAKSRQVIAVDLHGHGRTTLGDRPIDLIDIGNDLALVLDKLGLEQVDVAGYSFGGGAGLRLAIQHPAARPPPNDHLGALRADRLLPGDAAAAGGGRRGDGRADEGDADVHVVRGGRAEP